MRTPEDFVDALTKAGTNWSGILSVAGACRGGTWRSRVKEILLQRNMMPTDDAERNKMRDEYIKESKKISDEKERKKIAGRPRFKKKPILDIKTQ